VLHKRLRLRAYKIQMIHALKPSDHVARTNFAVDLLERTGASPDFLLQVCFSDETVFRASGVVHRYNHRIWGSQNQHVTCCPEVNVWTGLMHKLIGPFELYALPQLPTQTILQQNWAPPHFGHHVRNHLDRVMVGRSIGRSGPIARPPKSPDLVKILHEIVVRVCRQNDAPMMAHSTNFESRLLFANSRLSVITYRHLHKEAYLEESIETSKSVFFPQH
ncbi:hypothetical protein B7P43_G00325, partial [Cryptotermes secundus]